jgi:hypothetical protein
MARASCLLSPIDGVVPSETLFKAKVLGEHRKAARSDDKPIYSSRRCLHFHDGFPNHPLLPEAAFYDPLA